MLDTGAAGRHSSWTRRRVPIHSLAICAFLAVAGCVGDIGDPSGSDSTTGDLQPAGLRLLTPVQYQNSIRDVLGADVPVQAVGQWRSSLAAAQGGVSLTAVEEYETAALEAAEFVFSDPGRRAALAGCEPSIDAADACVTGLLQTLGRRAFRRALTATETARYATLAANTAALFDEPWRGVEYAVAGLLQSPDFLYRVELGEPDPDDPSRLRFTSHDMAARLSYFIWNTTPDEELLLAAGADALVFDAGLGAQVTRLLASDRARAGAGQFFGDLLDVDSLLYVEKDTNWAPAFTDTIGPAMRDQLRLTIDQVALSENGDYRDLFDTRSTFVNAELAALLGLPGAFGDALEPVTLPEGPRAGLLALPGILTLNSGESSTSPTLRGKFVRNVLLCQSIPPPPAGVTAELPDAKPGEPVTTRDLLSQHLTDESCASCHRFMDPIGFALENFDAIGTFRAEQNEITIDASGDIDGTKFADAAGLGSAMRDHELLAPCFMRNLYRYGAGHIEQGIEVGTVDELSQSFVEDGYRVRAAFELVALSKSFRLAAIPTGIEEGGK